MKKVFAKLLYKSPEPLLFMGGRFLVLDVDETLLNIEPTSFLRLFRKDYAKQGKTVRFPGVKGEYHLTPRPNVKNFLEQTSKEYSLVAYSVVERSFTQEKLERLELAHYFKKVFGKEDLVGKKKSLARVAELLNVSVNDLVAIDDKPNMYLESARVIPVKPWFANDYEYELESRPDNLLGVLQVLRSPTLFLPVQELLAQQSSAVVR